MRDYYSVKAKKIGDEDTVEKFFAWVEGRTSPIVKKLGRKERISTREIVDLSLFVTCLLVRSQQFGTEIEKFVIESARNIGIEKFGSELMDSIELGVKSDFVHLMRIKIFSELGLEFNKLDWTIHWARKGSSFITCDNPFTIMAPPEVNPTKVGIFTPGARKLVPMTQNCCLGIFEKGNEWGYNTLPNQVMKFINRTIALNSTRFIVARDKELLTSLVSYCKKYNWTKPFEDLQ